MVYFILALKVLEADLVKIKNKHVKGWYNRWNWSW